MFRSPLTDLSIKSEEEPTRKDNISQSSVFYSNFVSSFQQCDAAIVTTSYAYESVSLDAVKQWFADMRKEVHVLGPLLPPGYGTDTQNNEETSVDIEKFLGEMLVQHGKQSVFFVKFFFPFQLCSNQIIFLRYPLALSTGRQFQNTLTN